jgi:hypothetical protein
VGYQTLSGNLPADNYYAISIGVLCEIVAYYWLLCLIKHWGNIVSSWFKSSRTLGIYNDTSSAIIMVQQLLVLFLTG